MVATLEVDVDSSDFLGQKLERSRLFANISERKLTGSIDIGLGPMRSTLTAMLEEQPGTQPSFSIRGDVRSLHLEDLFRDKSLDSDISFDIDAVGTGLTLDKLSGDFQIEFLSSRYRDYQMSSGDVHLRLDQNNPLEKTLILESNIADFSLTGAFDTEYMVKLIIYELQNVRLALGEKFAMIDSTLERNVDRKEFEFLGRSLSSVTTMLDAEYSLHVKDLEPISIITENRIFNGIGRLTGSIKGNYENLSLHARLDADEFFYGNVESGVLIENASATLDVEGLKPFKPLKEVGIRFTTDAGRMHLNKSEFDSLRVSLTYQQGYSLYTAQATFDEDIRLVVQGLANVTEDQVVFTLNDLRVAYHDFAWKADGGATISFGTSSVHVQDLAMRRGTEVVTLDGSIVGNGVLNGSIAAKKLDLDDLRFFLSKEELDPKRLSFSGFADFDLTVSGTLDEPEYSASLRADGVTFRRVLFGEIRAVFNYRNKILETNVEVENRQSRMEGVPTLTIAGTLPINLGFTNVHERWPDIPMDLFVRSDGIQVNLLDPLLPTFNDLHGILTCDIEIAGSPKNPIYRGEMRIDSCYFLFVPNNVYYTMEATLVPEGERIKVIDAVIRNVPSDEQPGRAGLMRVKGDFALGEFTPADFDLTGTGQLLVVKSETRKSELSVYGNLFVEIGASGLHFTGDPNQSLLKGTIHISNSRLIFPPTQASVAEQTGFSIPVIVVDDTSKVISKPTRPSAARYFQTAGEESMSITSLSTDETASKSFLDGMRYDLDIETSGVNTEIRMIFSTTPPEELQANIRGKFSITGDREQWIGDLEVVRAYYYFYKQFDAEGTIRYSGDFLNPELDIKATYQGTRVLPDTVSEGKSEKVIVILHITGTRNEPALEVSMTIDDVDYYSYTGPTSSDVQSDAIAFILAGTFPLTRSEANNVASDVGSTVGLSLVKGASSLLTSELSDFLRRETGFITSFELSHGSQGTDVRVSGTVFKGLWRIGGRIQDDPFNNASVSLIYSFGDIFDRPSLRNFMFELDRSVEIGTIGLANDKKEVNSARLFYRFSF